MNVSQKHFKIFYFLFIALTMGFSALDFDKIYDNGGKEFLETEYKEFQCTPKSLFKQYVPSLLSWHFLQVPSKFTSFISSNFISIICNSSSSI